MADKDIAAWECRNSELHADCRVYRILREHWENPQEKISADFFVMEVNDWAVTIALTAEGNCVLVKQFRFGTGDFSWEFPAGVVDPGEDPLEAGLRELYEESGYQGKSARILSVVHPNPAIQRNKCHLILVEDARRIDRGDPGLNEFFEVREVPVATLFQLARDGTITHSIVQAGLFFLRDYLDGQSSVNA